MGRMVRQGVCFGGWAWLVAASLALVTAQDALGDGVQLRRSASVGATSAVTLGDVAALEGEYAQSLRNIVILEPASSDKAKPWITVELAQVREALQAQGVRMGALSISGDACTVRMGEVELEIATRDTAPEPVITAWEEYEVADVTGATDVPSVIVAQLAEQLGLATSDHIRVRFDDAFETALAEVSGKRVGVEARSSASGGAALFGLTAYDEYGGIAGAWTVRVEAQVWRMALRMTRTVNRRGTLSAGDITSAMEWVGVGDAVLSELGEVIGSEARVRLSEGEFVRTGQLEAPLAIRRGDLVQVHCLSGGLVVRGRARALAHGRTGELIECKLEDAERSFLARVDGPGRVVMEAVVADEPVVENK